LKTFSSKLQQKHGATRTKQLHTEASCSNGALSPAFSKCIR